MRKVVYALVTVILIGVMSCPITVFASNEDDVLAYINAYRESAGLTDLTVDADLASAAAVRAQECSIKFSHTRPDGKAWSTVSDLTKGENLAHARNNNQQKPENVVYAWMLSPKHKANVMRESFTAVGISYYSTDTGETYIACEFR